MKRKSIFTSILIALGSLLALLPLPAQAQKGGTKRKVVAKTTPDSIPLFRGFAVGTDLIGMGQRLVADYGQYEACLILNLKDCYFPTIEVGYGQADKLSDATNIRYKTAAPYARVGCDYNVLRNKHDSYRLLVGARVAYTSFKYDISSPGVTDPVWGGHTEYAANDESCSMLWAEIVGRLDAAIAGPLRMGWSVRYRTRITNKQGEMGAPWYVPGFGKNGSTRLAATFHILLEF